MATEVILPRVDMDMTEGKIAFWYVKNGDAVTKGQILFDIETDKATMEVDAAVAGVIDSITGEIGVTMPVGQVVAWIRAPGEALVGAASGSLAPADSDVPDLAAASVEPDSATGGSTSSPASMPDVVSSSGSVASPSVPADLLRATPLARSLARTRGVDLSSLTGSGPRGRIYADDVPASAGTEPAATKLHLHWWQRTGGAPLLLLHGFGADHASWRPLVQQLSPNQSVAGIDLPNHGKSSLQSVESIAKMAQAVLERMDQEGIAACHLLGHSMGGGVALAISAAQPERVLSLTLLAPVGLGTEIDGEFIDGLIGAESEAALKLSLSRLFHDPAALTASFVATAFKQLQAPGRAAALTGMAKHLMPEGVQTGSLRAALKGIKGPVKVIWGLADQIIPSAHSAGMPGNVGLHLLPAVGHLAQIEATPLVARLLLQQIRAGTES